MTTTEPATVDHSIALADTMSAIAVGMGNLLDWSRAHPTMRLFRSDSWGIYAEDDQDPLDIIRAVKDGAAVGMVRKNFGTGNHEESLFIRRDFGGGIELFYIANREQVCERVVTGTETVEIPDPDAPKVTVEREVVEWKCAPILAGADA